LRWPLSASRARIGETVTVVVDNEEGRGGGVEDERLLWYNGRDCY